MKIGFLTPEYPHQAVENTSGGIGTSIYNLTKGLLNLKQNVVIIVYNQSCDEIIKCEGYSIYKIKNIKLKGLSWWLTRKKIEKLINKLYVEKHIDIIEAPDWTGITSFMKLYCPLVIKLNGSDTYFCHLEKRPVKWKNRFHEKKALKSADAHISVSRFTANKTNEIFKTNIDFNIIPNAIDTAFFKPGKTEKKTPTYKILYFGTLIRKKGALEIPFIFNNVVESLPQAELILIGHDSYDIQTKNISTYALMKTLFNEKALKQQQYLGKVPYSQIKNHIETADVVIFPSFIEALPLSWLEAMAMEKVIVASDIGWAKEMINHGKNGFIHYPKNHNAFAKSVIDVLLKKVDVEELSSKARTTVIEKFSSKRVAEKNLDFYKNIIASK